ncbi:AraC family transcriptional regulator ligand-binding domain-containing protein [Streptomyces sp. NPDC003863]
MRDRTGTLRWYGVQRSSAGRVSSTGQAPKAGGDGLAGALAEPAPTAQRAGDEVDDVRLVLDAPGVPPALWRFSVERDAAGIATIQRELLASPAPFREVAFVFPPPAEGSGRYEELFGVAPTFDAEETLIGIGQSRLDLPLPQASAHTEALALAQCRELPARRQARTGFAGRVRDVLVGRLPERPDADEVAARLHLATRTLRHGSPPREPRTERCSRRPANTSPRSS